jgi:homoaconitase/3-isopropylmalate dehydratase large subunit
MLQRRRLFFGSVDVQTAQLQPIIGTPCEAPVPRNVKFIISSLPKNVDLNRVFISLCADSKKYYYN